VKKLHLGTVAAVALLLGASGIGEAADLPLKAPPMVPPPLFSWTGFYLGGNIGAAWANRSVTDSFSGTTFSHSSDAVFIGGGQLGYNWQINNFLLGVEWDFDAIGSNNNGTGTGITINNAGPFTVTRGSDRWMSTLAARLGFTNDHWLFYGKLGGGEVSVSNFTVVNTATGGSIASTTSRSRTGFMWGAGFEYAFTNNWTMKVEYDRINLSSRSFIVPADAPFLVGDVFVTRHNDVDAVKVGFNYLFGRAGY